MVMTTDPCGKILLPLNQFHHGLERILRIADLEKGKRIDLLYIKGVDKKSAQYSPFAQFTEVKRESPDIGNCYVCDATEVIRILKEGMNDDVLLWDYQMRHIAFSMILAHFIEIGGYEKVIYYGIYSDYRLNELPASYPMKKGKYYCLLNEIKDETPSGKILRRHCLSQASGIIDHRPQFEYVMKEKKIRKLCRRVMNSHVLESLKLEKVIV